MENRKKERRGSQEKGREREKPGKEEEERRKNEKERKKLGKRDDKGMMENYFLLSLCSLFLFLGHCHRDVDLFVLLYTFTVLNQLQFKDEIIGQNKY